jgi:hypothetical protein
MTQANDSILVTPGSGATVATHLANSKEHQVMMLAGADGHILGSQNAYFYNIPSQVHVASANTVHWDLFNASSTVVVRVTSIRQMPNVVTAVTGIAFAWLLERSTAAGTGGSTLTAWLPDSTQSAIDGNITARSKPTGGATQSTDLWNYTIHSEETNAGTIIISAQGGLEIVPQLLLPINGGSGIVLRQNEGIRCVQVTSSIEGNTGWLISITTE